MRLSQGIDSLANENRYLKAAILVVLVICALELGLILEIYNQPPLVVERSSRGMELVRVQEFARTEDDLKEAIRLMIQARFNSRAVATEVFLNPKQMVLRETEQKELRSRNMSQSVVVNKVLIEKNKASVELDRVISYGEVRSALKASLRVSFEEVSPNELNPYGLLLSIAEPINQEEKK